MPITPSMRVLFLLKNKLPSIIPKQGETKNLSLSVVAGYYGTDDGKPNLSQKSIMKGGEKNMMEAILIGSIIASIIVGLGIISLASMYIIYRCTGGKKSFLWYIRHI